MPENPTNGPLKWRRRLIKAVVILAAVAGLGWWNSEFFHEQFMGWDYGQSELAARKYGWNMPADISRVEIFQVVRDGRSTNRLISKASGTVKTFSVLSTQILNAKEAAAFRGQWNGMHFHWLLSGLCHETAFVIRFHQGKRLYLETDVCFQCSNFYVPGILGPSLMGFDEKNRDGKRMLETMTNLFPDFLELAELRRKLDAPVSKDPK
jgi:hypothetical protein